MALCLWADDRWGADPDLDHVAAWNLVGVGVFSDGHVGDALAGNLRDALVAK